jgi:hypothetical protein
MIKNTSTKYFRFGRSFKAKPHNQNNLIPALIRATAVAGFGAASLHTVGPAMRAGELALSMRQMALFTHLPLTSPAVHSDTSSPILPLPLGERGG